MSDPSRLITVHQLDALRRQVDAWRQDGERIAFVPTMGNLHAGHLALIDFARSLADRVVASIFVNPTQFGAGEDLDSYPRTLDEDQAGLTAHHCDLLYAPPVAQMYPSGVGEGTMIRVPGALTDRLCGRSRPGHFDGVATVVVTLLNQVRPDHAVFGEKDFQQLLVIRRVVQDLSLPVQIHGMPTVREASGLALSSRNGYLSADQRGAAAVLSRVLQTICDGLMAGEQEAAALLDQGRQQIDAAGLETEYLELLSAKDLQAPRPGEARVVLVAARLGPARLIDNMRVPEQPIETI